MKEHKTIEDTLKVHNPPRPPDVWLAGLARQIEISLEILPLQILALKAQCEGENLCGQIETTFSANRGWEVGQAEKKWGQAAILPENK